jgi:Xaa-Pro aminopeptidase
MIGQRLARLRNYLRQQHLDGIVLMRAENLRYFSGFTGGEGILFVTAVIAELWTDSRYTEQAAAQSGEFYQVRNHAGKMYEMAGKSIGQAKQASQADPYILAYEDDFLPYSAYCGMNEYAQCQFQGVAVNTLRAVKEFDELANIRQACKIADEAFEKLLPSIRPGVTEQSLSAQLESYMLLSGSEEKSFYTIVASGKRSSMPHGAASSKVVETGDFVTFDFGAVYNGYHSDITRTIVVGKATQEQRDFYDLVLQGQLLGVDCIRAGMSCREADFRVRNYFSMRYVNQYFTHSLGHGVGLQIHEQPVLAPRGSGALKENMIVTVEPGLYIEGKYGVRIEDSVAVTAEGCEILTSTPKHLIEIL